MTVRASSEGIPMCGREVRGAQHAVVDLFVGATWFLTPIADTDTPRYRDLHAFVASLGAEPVAIDPGAHDRLLALTSHLPHVIANLLVNQAGAGRIDGHDPLVRERRQLPRHDARGGREPAHLGRHLPRQPRGAGRGDPRAPPALGRGARSARARRRGLPRPLDRAGRRRTAGARSRSRTSAGPRRWSRSTRTSPTARA